MPHGNTIINGNGIKLGSIASHAFNLCFHQLSNLMQVCMTGHKLCERIDHGNNRFSHLFGFHACSHP